MHFIDMYEAYFYISESISLDSSNATIKEHFDTIIKVKAEKNIKGAASR